MLRTLIHCNTGLTKPTLCLQMCRKIGQERQQVGLIRLRTGIERQLAGTVGALVIVLKSQMPRHNRIAINLLRNATAHHKLHPTVEHGIVVTPGAIHRLTLANHTLEGILRLRVPWMLNDAGRNHLLSSSRQLLHQRTHQLEMRLTPQGNLVKTSHRIGILPQI